MGTSGGDGYKGVRSDQIGPTRGDGVEAAFRRVEEDPILAPVGAVSHQLILLPALRVERVDDPKDPTQIVAMRCS